MRFIRDGKLIRKAKWDLRNKKISRTKNSCNGHSRPEFQDFSCDPEAITKRVFTQNWGYILTPDSYYESIINWIKKDMARNFKDPTLVATGVLPAIQSAIGAFCP